MAKTRASNPYAVQGGTRSGGVAQKQSGGSTMQGSASGKPYTPVSGGGGGVKQKQSGNSTMQPAGHMTGGGRAVPSGIKRPR